MNRAPDEPAFVAQRTRLVEELEDAWAVVLQQIARCKHTSSPIALNLQLLELRTRLDDLNLRVAQARKDLHERYPESL